MKPTELAVRSALKAVTLGAFMLTAVTGVATAAADAPSATGAEPGTECSVRSGLCTFDSPAAVGAHESSDSRHGANVESGPTKIVPPATVAAPGVRAYTPTIPGNHNDGFAGYIELGPQSERHLPGGNDGITGGIELPHASTTNPDKRHLPGGNDGITGGISLPNVSTTPR